MSKRHYAVFYDSGNVWLTACGLPLWAMVEMWKDKRKVTCKRCKKTKIFKNKIILIV